SWRKCWTYAEQTKRRNPSERRGAALRSTPPRVQVSFHFNRDPSPRFKNAVFPDKILRIPAKKAADCYPASTECTRNIHSFCCALFNKTRHPSSPAMKRGSIGYTAFANQRHLESRVRLRIRTGYLECRDVLVGGGEPGGTMRWSVGLT